MSDEKHTESIIGKTKKKPVRVTEATQVVNLFTEVVQEVHKRRAEMLGGPRQAEHPFWMNAGRMMQLPTDFYVTGVLNQEMFLRLHGEALAEMASGQQVVVRMPKNLPRLFTTADAISYLEGIAVEVEKHRNVCDVFVPQDEMTGVQKQFAEFRKYLMTVGRGLQAPKDLWAVGLIDGVAFQAMHQRGLNTLAARVVGVT